MDKKMNPRNRTLSRECIRDTLLAKRSGALKSADALRTLYNVGIRNLRDGQLAPHREPWHENRILDMQMERRHPPKIIIFVHNGLVEEVFSTNPNTVVEVADYDMDHESAEQMERLREAADRVNQPDMYSVYYA